jgi:putative ABC transport system ATP-binding protein
VNRPRLLLADEPTGNLDSATSEEILLLLHDLHRDGNTVVLVTHDAAIGARAQRLVTIRDGRVERDARS